MFTKLASNITFSDVEDFCRKFGEGIRVEYKRDFDIKKHIPKTVSAFANTQGGIFIIGAETDKKTNQVIAIGGIPNSGGIEEQIQQSALTGIYPAVIPEVILCDVPADPNNVVIIVRVEESPQAPHAIQNSTRVYIRTGSITQPYELKLADIDQIQHMLKRREDSQTTIRQIRNRTEDRIESRFSASEPNIAVIAHPVFPHRPIMSTGEIYELIRMNNSFPFNDWDGSFGTRRVAGGVCFMGSTNNILYSELNEYGFVYRREALFEEIPKHSDEQEGYFHYRQFLLPVNELIRYARSLYEKCGYFGNIEITAQLEQVYMRKLGFRGSDEGVSSADFESIERQECLDSQVSASTQCLAQDLMEEEFIEVVDKLVEQLFWAFNVHDSTQRRGLLKRFYSRE